MEDLGKEPPENSYYFVKPPKKAIDKEIYLEITFEQGAPLALKIGRAHV